MFCFNFVSYFNFLFVGSLPRGTLMGSPHPESLTSGLCYFHFVNKIVEDPEPSELSKMTQARVHQSQFGWLQSTGSWHFAAGLWKHHVEFIRKVWSRRREFSAAGAASHREGGIHEHRNWRNVSISLDEKVRGWACAWPCEKHCVGKGILTSLPAWRFYPS